MKKIISFYTILILTSLLFVACPTAGELCSSSITVYNEGDVPIVVIVEVEENDDTNAYTADGNKTIEPGGNDKWLISWTPTEDFRNCSALFSVRPVEGYGQSYEERRYTFSTCGKNRNWRVSYAASPDTTPPVWRSDVAIMRVRAASSNSIEVTWGTAEDDRSPPVTYLVYISTRNRLWNETPVPLSGDNHSYLFTDLESHVRYILGVRARDNAPTPNIDSNDQTMDIYLGTEGQ